MSNAARPVCSVASHEALKLDRERYLAETHPVGYQDLGDGQRCMIRNHTCGSSLLAEWEIQIYDEAAYRAFLAEMWAEAVYDYKPLVGVVLGGVSA